MGYLREWFGKQTKKRLTFNELTLPIQQVNFYRKGKRYCQYSKLFFYRKGKLFLSDKRSDTAYKADQGSPKKRTKVQCLWQNCKFRAR